MYNHFYKMFFCYNSLLQSQYEKVRTMSWLDYELFLSYYSTHVPDLRAKNDSVPEKLVFWMKFWIFWMNFQFLFLDGISVFFLDENQVFCVVMPSHFFFFINITSIVTAKKRLVNKLVKL